MAEVMSGSVTVMVLTDCEVSALTEVLRQVGYEVAEPWPVLVGDLHEVYAALGVPSFTTEDEGV